MIDFDGRSVLVTGANSGLGKFIFQRLIGATALTRKNRDDIVNGKKYDIRDLVIDFGYHESIESSLTASIPLPPAIIRIWSSVNST